MDQNDLLDEGLSSKPEYGVTQNAIGFMETARKWGFFIAIFGMVIAGIIAIVAIFASSALSMAMGANFGSGIIIAVYLFMAVLYFIPCFYLYKFSNYLKMANQSKDALHLENAMANLKSFFKFIGIFILVILSIYALIFLFGAMSIF